MKKFQNSEGFTLIELIVVIVVLIAVGTVITGILVSALRGSNKSKAINNLETNGNYATAQISKISRFAKYFDGVSTDGVNYATNCAQPTPATTATPTPTPASYKYVKVRAYEGGTIVFACEASTISSNGASLLDTNTVSLTSCSFSCSQSSPSDYPSIGIQFTLSQYRPTTALNFVENSASATFQTTVSFRNFHR